MNIYNLKEMKKEKYAYNNFAENLIKEYRKNIKIISILVAIVTSIIVVLFINKGKLFISLLVYILTIYILTFKIASMQYKCIKTAEKNSYESLHDYYYYLYTIIKSKRTKNKYLLKICRCNIFMKRYESGYKSLESIDFSKLSTNDKSKFYSIKAALNKLNGDEDEFLKNIGLYIKNERLCGKLNKYLKNIEILKNGTPEAINEILKEDKVQKISFKCIKFLMYLFMFINFVVLYKNIPELVGKNIEYRSYIEILGYTIIFAGFITFPAIAIVYITKKIGQYKKSAKVISIVIGTILYLIYVAIFSFIMLFGYGDLTTEKKIDDNTIEVVRPVFLSESKYYYCKPYTIFFRKVISYDENYLENRNDPNYSDYTDSGEEENKTETTVNGGYNKIYESEFEDSSDTFEFSTSAKGDTYVIIGPEKEKELDGENVTTLRRLVYSGESENKKCYLYVCYEDHYGQDGNIQNNTSILNFYAVNKSTGEVIKADKTSWSDSGCEEYREATEK